jgi:hypothetical protein
MTTLAAVAFGPATLRILKISYRCDLSRTDGLIIPLGILADMRAANTYVLGLVARKSLSVDEAFQVGELVRADISAPFNYLDPIFENVIHAPAPGEAFEALQDKYSLSLAFEMTEPARSITLPQAAKISSEARGLWLKDTLHSHGTGAYWEMFGEAVPPEVDKDSKEQDIAA